MGKGLLQNGEVLQQPHLSRDAGLETGHSKRQGYSNFGNRRSLSGQRAFLKVGKHAPDRGGIEVSGQLFTSFF